MRAFKPPNPQPPGPQQPGGAAHCRASQNRDASYGAECSAPAARVVRHAERSAATQIQPVEQPKLAFETPGQNGPSEYKGQAKLTPPKASVQEAIHDIARGGGGQGSVVVGDLDRPPDLPESIHLPPSPGHTGSSLELMSDPLGVDFKPYLIQILSLVREELVRRDSGERAPRQSRGGGDCSSSSIGTGDVPKLVIATPSGSEALDKAAVAGISASVPFPPFPKDFNGQQIRLQFSFKYNFK